jgi:hypothetical protein
MHNAKSYEIDENLIQTITYQKGARDQCFKYLYILSD